MSSGCPKCGFDLEAGKPCRVCGYFPAPAPGVQPQRSTVPAAHGPAIPGAPGAPSVKTAPKPMPASTGAQAVRRRGGPQGPIVVLITAGLGLLAVLGVFILGDLRLKAPIQEAGSAAAPSAVAAVPAVSPAEPAPAPTPDPAPAPDPVAAPAPAPASLPRSATVLDVDEPPFDITNRPEDPPTIDRTSYVAWMRAQTDQKEKFLLQKWALAQTMLAYHTVTHPRILDAILRAPREFFCRDPRRAYEDAVLPIGYGQTISGPHMVGRMTDYLDPQPEQKVLEIGTGSGYQSSVLSELSNHVYTIEIVEPLARETDAIYRAHEARYPEYRNIHRKVDDGYFGWPQHAPFDRIIVTCGIDHVPPELLRELAPEGIMVIPVGPPSGQTILRIVKHVDEDGTVSLDREDIFQGKKRQIFVPFTSKQGGVHVFEDKKEVE